MKHKINKGWIVDFLYFLLITTVFFFLVTIELFEWWDKTNWIGMTCIILAPFVGGLLGSIPFILKK